MNAWQAQFVAHVTKMLIDLVPDYARPRVVYWCDHNRLDLVAWMVSEHVEVIQTVVWCELDLMMEQLVIDGIDKNL